MTREDFMRAVRVKVPSSLPQESIEFAVARYCREGKMTEKGVAHCVEIATFLSESWSFFLERQASSVHSSPDVDEARSIAARLTEDELLEKMQPFVQGTRETISQQDQAPCDSREAAAAWLQDKAKRRPVPCEEHARLSQIDHDLRTLRHEWRARTGVEWRDDGGHDVLVYRDGEGGVKTISLEGPDPREEHPTMPSPELVGLHHAVEHMHDVTGFYKDSLITYILTDIPPTLPAFKTTASIIHHGMTGISRTQSTIDILVGDVRFEELHQVYHQVRKRFSTTRKKRLSPQDAAFLALVKRYEPIPEGTGSGAMAVWENIRQEMNRKEGRKVLKDAAFARRKHVRLIERLANKGVKR